MEFYISTSGSASWIIAKANLMKVFGDASYSPLGLTVVLLFVTWTTLKLASIRFYALNYLEDLYFSTKLFFINFRDVLHEQKLHINAILWRTMRIQRVYVERKKMIRH